MSKFSDVVAEVATRADIVSVARELGLTVAARRAGPAKALCPFHNDKDPSLHLYPAKGADRAHYHCYVCDAHGDVFDLVKRRRGEDFSKAVEWLAGLFGVALPERRDANWGKADERAGMDAVSSAARQASEDAALSERFAAVSRSRGYDPSFLRAAGIGLLSLDGLIRRAVSEPEIAEALVEAGVLHRVEEAAGQRELWGGNEALRGFFRGERLVFPLQDKDGKVVGFAARSVSGADKGPKYLYSRGFPRKDTLYRADRVLRELRKGARKSRLELHVVEGLFDALRMESLGFDAVAVLGSRLSVPQAKVLEAIKRQCDTHDIELVVRVFLDSDEAGRRGAYDTVMDLLRLAGEAGPFGIEVVAAPGGEGGKADPDDWLRDRTPEEASKKLAEATVGAVRFLAAFRLGVDFGERLPGGPRAANAARQIAHALSSGGWRKAVSGLDFSGDPEAEQFAGLVALFSDGRAPARVPVASREHPSDREALTRALALARSSASRREYPSDDGSWERLAVSASAFHHIHVARLRSGDGLSAPLQARHVPKDDGRLRLKSGPVPDDAVLQQYMLGELLAVREDGQFHRRVPAVRHWPAMGGAPARTSTTGEDGERENTVSFAYQVDMGIIGGDVPPRREGIFRHYYDCWRDFVQFVAERMARMPYAELQVLRLDVSGFYDNLQRHDVRDALLPPLAQALGGLPESLGGASAFAPLFRPDIKDPIERAEQATAWLLGQSFGCRYRDPERPGVRRAKSEVGIPQGPDLSAYLANITLFGLDATMQAEVKALDEAAGGGGAVGGVYARYVDDIIIVCKDSETGARLRRVIETNLAKLNLRLNRKSVPPPPMTKAAARSWLTDSRGAGFNFSGPLADLPTTDAMDPLGDAGDIDRRTVLGLLFDKTLDDLGRREEALAVIRRALGSSNLRFNDRANTYRRLWSFASDQCGSDSHAELLANFLALVNDVEERLPLESPDLAGAVREASLWLEALERFLRNGVPQGAGLSDEAQSRLHAAQDRAARAFLNGMLFALPDILGLTQIARAEFLRHPGLLQHGLTCASVAAARLSATGKAEAVRGFLAELASEGLEPLHREGLTLMRHAGEFRSSQKLLEERETEPAARPLALLHESVARLQAFAEHGGAVPMAEGGGVDPLGPVAGLADGQLVIGGIAEMAKRLLAVWLPSVAKVEGLEEVEMDAASAFVNLTYPHFAALAAERPVLTQVLVGQADATHLPNPPGMECPGVLAWSGSEGCLYAVIRSDVDVAGALPGVDWTECKPGDRITVHRVAFPKGTRLLAVDGELDRKAWSPRDLADLYYAFYGPYRSLAAAEIDGGEGGHAVLPTAFSFFGPALAKSDGEVPWRVVAWRVRAANGMAHAFVRNGRSALQEQQIPREGAEHWRFGWAIRDLTDGRIDDGEGEDAPEAAAGQELGTEKLRRHAVLSRLFPRLCGRDNWGVGDRRGDGPPSRIERALDLLRRFPEDGAASAQATFAVVALAEGVFMNERLARHVPLHLPGGPATLAARSAQRACRGIHMAAAHWPPPPKLPSRLRRTARAWLALSASLSRRLPDLSGARDEGLRALAWGCASLALESALRSFALECVARLDPMEVELLRFCEPGREWLQAIGPDAVLYLDDEGDAGYDSTEQARLALGSFTDVVATNRNAFRSAQLKPITPLGWLTIAGMVGRLVELETEGRRPKLRQPRGMAVGASSPLPHGRKALDTLLPFVSAAQGSAEGQQWPWEAFVELGERASLLPVENIAEALVALDDYAGFEVTDAVSRRQGRMESEEAGAGWDWRSADGTVTPLRTWQIDVASLGGERANMFESDLGDGRRRFHWSETRDGERVVGVHMLSPQLAKAALGTGAGHAPEVAEPAAGAERRPATTAPSGAAVPPLPPSEEAVPPSESAESGPVGQLGGEPPMAGAHDQADDRAFAVHELGELQNSEWRRRGSDKSKSAFRVALAQWDVTDSYESPDKDGGRYEGLLVFKDNEFRPAGSVSGAGGAYLSLGEYRRRKILLGLLRACREFRVDGLVLPEYALRAETVNWLARSLDGHVYPKTVWCGSFRVPEAAQVDRVGARFRPAEGTERPVGVDRYFGDAAVVSGLTSEGAKGDKPVRRLAAREKRYPAAAVGEEIRPPVTQPWDPLFSSADHVGDLAAYAFELVCSEIFPHASSANFPGLIEETMRLMANYGLPVPSDPEKELLEWIYDDVRRLAKWTSIVPAGGSLMGRGDAPRRSLAVVPAMTTRSADYHIFGQNQHLAAGLVTAFCNAVHKAYGCGHSCFIGVNAWNSESGSLPGNPYGGVVPGIFRPGGKDVIGPLTDKEAALVIADLNLVNPTDQKPRPHYQPAPLRLVAHLPLIFSTEGVPRDAFGHINYPDKSRRIRLRTLCDETLSAAPATGQDSANASSTEFRTLTFVKAMRRHFTKLVEHYRGEDYREGRLTDAELTAECIAAMRVLEEFADAPHWLARRREAFHRRRPASASPVAPAALFDWLWIDDEWSDTDAVEKRCQDPCEDTFSDDRPFIHVPARDAEAQRAVQDAPESAPVGVDVAGGEAALPQDGGGADAQAAGAEEAEGG